MVDREKEKEEGPVFIVKDRLAWNQRVGRKERGCWLKQKPGNGMDRRLLNGFNGEVMLDGGSGLGCEPAPMGHRSLQSSKGVNWKLKGLVNEMAI